MRVAWPPEGAQAILLDQLAEIIARGGAAHLLDAPVVKMDTRDFPDAWKPTRAAVERLLARLFWHAHVDLDVAIDDLRAPDAGHDLLSRSVIEWVQTADGVAEFQLEAIGNDNVAGALSHEIGRAYLAWIAAATPYREARSTPTDREGSIAAVYLGLGVLAANAAEYHRSAGELRGRTAVTAWDVVMTGGLSPDEAIYLLAVQAVLRRAPIDAHATLRGELRDRLRETIAGLAPHREALAARLALDLDAPRPPLERDPAPARVTDAERPEPDRRARWADADTYRVSERRTGLGVLGGLVLGVGALVALALATSGHAAPYLYLIAGLAPLAGGIVLGRRSRFDRCYWGQCLRPLPASAATCPGCGATIAGRFEDFRAELVRRAEEEDDRLDALRIAAEAEARGETGAEREGA